MFSDLKNKILLVLILLIVILTSSYYLGLSAYSIHYLRSFFNPFIATANSLTYKLGDFLSIYFIYPQLKADNQHLRQELINLSLQHVELESLKQENEFLKKELAFIEEYKYKHLITKVIGRTPVGNNFYLIINKGYLDGLKEGLAVTTYQGVIIGTIKKAQDHIAFVQLLTDSQSKISAIINAQPSSLGLIRGSYNINLKMELIPKETEIKIGDLVTTSGLDNYIPPGLLIGKIYSLQTDQEKLWQEALIEPTLDYHKIQLVDIILPD